MLRIKTSRVADESSSRTTILRRTPILAAAALALFATALVPIALWVGGGSVAYGQLSHHDMVRSCFAEFVRLIEFKKRGGIEEDPNSETSQEEHRRRALAIANASLTPGLDRLPDVPDSEIRGCVACELDDVSGVRVDYRIVDHENLVEYPLCISVFPLRCLTCSDGLLAKLEEGEDCSCLEGVDDTIYCFRSDEHVFNVVKTIDIETLETRYRPVLRKDEPCPR